MLLITTAILSFQVLTAVSQSDNVESLTKNLDEICDFIDRIQIYKESVKIKKSKEHFFGVFVDEIDPSTFNLKTYIDMYSALKKRKESYVFDCYYYDNFLDGKPYIYVKSKNNNLIEDIKKEADKRLLEGDKRDDYIYRSLSYFLNDPYYDANNNIYPKDTEEGYCQYLYFCEFGELFALKWHANYSNKKVICSMKKIEEVVKEYTEKERSSEDILHCDTAALQNLLVRDSPISIQIDIDNVIIKWVELEDWQGIFERSYKIMRTSPYSIELIEEKKLAEIHKEYIL